MPLSSIISSLNFPFLSVTKVNKTLSSESLNSNSTPSNGIPAGSLFNVLSSNTVLFIFKNPTGTGSLVKLKYLLSSFLSIVKYTGSSLSIQSSFTQVSLIQ